MPKKVLVISPVSSHPQDAGHRARIYNLLINLQKLGHEVHFLHLQQWTTDDAQMYKAWGERFYSFPCVKAEERKRGLIQKIIRKLKIFLADYPKYPYAIDDWYDDSVNKFLLELQKKHKFEVVIVEYVFFSKALKCFSKNTLKIIDTHDKFSNRIELYQKNSQQYHWYSTTPKEEKKGLKRADWVIAIQEEEKEHFQNLVGDKVIMIGHTVSLRQPKKLPKSSKKILYIASKNDINSYSINHFINEVLPKVRLHLSDVKLLIAGKICEIIEESEGCIKLGYVDNLEEVYDTADVVINPILFGTGLKIKSIEALGQSKVLITTPEGAKGLEMGLNKAFLTARNTEEFTQLLIKVLTNPILSDHLSQNAYEFAENYNNKAFEALVKILDEI